MEKAKLDREIDYDHVDVARIMEVIKGQAAGSFSSLREEPKAEPGRPEEPTPPAERASRRSQVKRLLLKFMTPFAPLIKLLILPVYEEQRQIFLRLHETNKRLDAFMSRREAEIERMREYIRLLHQLAHNIVVEMSKLKIEEEMLKTKTRVLEKDFTTLTRREREVEKEIFK